MKIGKQLISDMEKKTISKFINCLIIVAFMAYLVLGISIYRDYGISSDEPTERVSTLINTKYILEFLGIDKASELDVPNLEDYEYKYYGTFLQMPTMIWEIGSDDLKDAFYGRHLYTFGLCLMGYVAFFFLCKILLKSNAPALLGTAMLALYPRFFAEQFYNIKDMVFVSTFIIAMLATVKLIESKFKWNWIFCFAVAAAISTNVRIVGAIFLILILGYLLVDYICGKVCPTNYETQCKNPVLCGTVLVLLFLTVFVLILPITWENPIQGIVNVFAKFSNYDDWDSTIVFMGKVIRKEELPWYYVPVWLLISLPVWYLLLFAVVMTTAICICIKKIKNKDRLILELLSKYKYVIWCISLIVGPWLGIVMMHSTIYNGWRHCYFLLPPLVLLIVIGVDYLFRVKRKYFMALFPVMIIGVILQITWIVRNHPYEMVYFNSAGKHFAASYDRDYWHLSALQAIRYILENDEEGKVSIKTPGNDYYRYLLTDEERDRIIEEESPKYIIETYRGKLGNDLKMDDYREIYSITVDNFKVATIFKKDSEN